MTKKDVKSCFGIKKMISTSERYAEHPFAGRNTQHLWSKIWSSGCLFIWSSGLGPQTQFG